MMLPPLFDELVKLGAMSDDQARESLKRLDSLESNAPTAGQVARYGALGAVTGPVIGGLGRKIRGDSFVKAVENVSHGKLRSAAGDAVVGALTSGAIPLVRSHLDRQSEKSKLKKYLKEHSQEKHSSAEDLLRLLQPAAKHMAAGALIGAVPMAARGLRKGREEGKSGVGGALLGALEGGTAGAALGFGAHHLGNLGSSAKQSLEQILAESGKLRGSVDQAVGMANAYRPTAEHAIGAVEGLKPSVGHIVDEVGRLRQTVEGLKPSIERGVGVAEKIAPHVQRGVVGRLFGLGGGA